MKMQDVTTPYYETPKMPTECDDMSDTKSPWLDKPDGEGWWWIEGRSRPYEVERDNKGELLVRTGNQSWMQPWGFNGARFQRVQPPREE